MIEYRQASNEAERDAAFVLVRANAIGAGQIPGCADSATADAMMTRLGSLRDRICWIVAVNGEEVIASIACLLHQEADVHLTVIAQGTNAAQFDRAVYRNLIVAITREVSWPGCCGNRWSVVMPPTPFVDVLDEVAGPIVVEDTTMPPLKRYTGTMDAPGEYA